MTIERLPREYPIGSTVWTNKGYGTVLARLGKYHLIWLQRLGWHKSVLAFFKKIFYNIYRKIKKGVF